MTREMFQFLPSFQDFWNGGNGQPASYTYPELSSPDKIPTLDYSGIGIDCLAGPTYIIQWNKIPFSPDDLLET